MAAIEAKINRIVKFYTEYGYEVKLLKNNNYPPTALHKVIFIAHFCCSYFDYHSILKTVEVGNTIDWRARTFTKYKDISEKELKRFINIFDPCPICFDSIIDFYYLCFSCKSYFCKKCIDNLVRDRCPICNLTTDEAKFWRWNDLYSIKSETFSN